jgi:branched-chain amino acid aminotransferase
LGLQPTETAQEILALALEGVAFFPQGTPLYIRPMFWAESGLVLFDPASTEFALVITKMPLPDPAAGFSACLSTFRRPGPDQAPTHAKAAWLMIGRNGSVITPVPNGTFLNGVTRQRVIQLLRTSGVEVIERTIPVDELAEADEIFSTGNHGKVVPCLRYEERRFAPGPLAAKARELYWSYAHRGASARMPDRAVQRA